MVGWSTGLSEERGKHSLLGRSSGGRARGRGSAGVGRTVALGPAPNGRVWPAEEAVDALGRAVSQTNPKPRILLTVAAGVALQRSRAVGRAASEVLDRRTIEET